MCLLDDHRQKQLQGLGEANGYAPPPIAFLAASEIVAISSLLALPVTCTAAPLASIFTLLTTVSGMPNAAAPPLTVSNIFVASSALALAVSSVSKPTDASSSSPPLRSTQPAASFAPAAGPSAISAGILPAAQIGLPVSVRPTTSLRLLSMADLPLPSMSSLTEPSQSLPATATMFSLTTQPVPLPSAMLRVTVPSFSSTVHGSVPSFSLI